MLGNFFFGNIVASDRKLLSKMISCRLEKCEMPTKKKKSISGRTKKIKLEKSYNRAKSKSSTRNRRGWCLSRNSRQLFGLGFHQRRARSKEAEGGKTNEDMKWKARLLITHVLNINYSPSSRSRSNWKSFSSFWINYCETLIVNSFNSEHRKTNIREMKVKIVKL